MAEYVCTGAVEEGASVTHAPIAEPESPLASSEAIELREPPRSRARATVFTVAAVTLLAALSGWFLIGPGSPSSTIDVSSMIDVPEGMALAPAPATTSSQPKPTAALDPDTPVAQPVASPDADAAFLDAVRGARIFTNPASALGVAHRVCGLVSQGNTDSNIVRAMIRDNPTFTTANAEGFIGAAVAAYCPQYSSELGR